MFRRLLTAATLATLFVNAAPAQTTAPPDASRLLTAEKMWAMKRLGDPAITPDGRLAVVPVTTYDIAENKGLTDLWLVPVAGPERRRSAPAHQRQGQRQRNPP